MLRVLAAEDRAQCAGRGLGPGPGGAAGGQTRSHRASGLHPGDDDDSDSDDDYCIYRIGGEAILHGAGHTTTRSIPQVSVFALFLFAIARKKYWKNSGPQSQCFPPERGLC